MLKQKSVSKADLGWDEKKSRNKSKYATRKTHRELQQLRTLGLRYGQEPVFEEDEIDFSLA